MNSFVFFFNGVLCKKRFFLPLLFFSIVAYSFSLYNRTISWDDLLRDHYYFNIDVSGRWGGPLWITLLGLTELDPFVDRFLALTFLICTSLLLCYLFYRIDKNVDILSYTLLASGFVTFPLINEIWEYCVVNFNLTAGLFLSTFAILVMLSSIKAAYKFLLSSALLLLPISSYESSIFYYFSLACIILFYESYVDVQKQIRVKEWFIKMFLFLTPVFIAVISRFLISFFINTVFDLDYHSGGATGIHWISGSFFAVLRGMFVSNIIYYVVSGLVYFPITVFCISLVVYLILLFKVPMKKNTVLLGLLVILSIFSQAFLQGGCLPYRNAQTISLFVAFVIYLIANISNRRSLTFHYIIITVLLGLCWHQAVYLNRLLGLNNLRSNNEMSIIRQIGKDLMANYDTKPIVIVTPYKIGEWINRQVTVDESSLNGKLFCKILSKITLPYKFVDTNINCATEQYAALKNYFAYCGFDVEIAGPVERPHTAEYRHKDLTQIEAATDWAKSNKMRPYQIKDVGDYIIVSLGNNQSLNTNGGITYFFDYFKTK